jgi:hypothetical protein
MRPEVAMSSTTEPVPPSYDAEYTLETPLRCPGCNAEINSVGVVRLMRIRVNFISMLPRRGHVIVCPSCGRILSAELGGVA